MRLISDIWISFHLAGIWRMRMDGFLVWPKKKKKCGWHYPSNPDSSSLVAVHWTISTRRREPKKANLVLCAVSSLTFLPRPINSFWDPDKILDSPSPGTPSCGAFSIPVVISRLHRTYLCGARLLPVRSSPFGFTVFVFGVKDIHSFGGRLLPCGINSPKYGVLLRFSFVANVFQW